MSERMVMQALRDHTRAKEGGGPFRLSSGKSSGFYCDVVGAIAGEDGGRLLAYLASGVIARVSQYEVPAFAGVAFGGAMLVAACGVLSYCVSPVYLRYKDWRGTDGCVMKTRREWTVAGDVCGKPVVVVGDVATTGGSLLGAISAVRNAGGIVDTAIVAVDREEGAERALAGVGVRLEGMTTLREILEVGE
jgi:orotate phosphoribosyltransferase